MFNQGDLFSSDEPTKKNFDLPNSDITFFENFFTKNESNNLFERLKTQIKWQQDKIQFYGKSYDLPRLTAWYGDPGLNYTYSGIPMNPHPWNDDLKLIKSRLEKEAQVEFTSCLLNLYRSGKDKVSWHQDNEKELGVNPVIGSVSFGETRPFQLKHLDLVDLPKTDIYLTHGSFLLMKGETQHYWKHQIPPTKKEIQPRINLTFRVIS